MKNKKNIPEDNIILIVCDCLRLDHAYDPDIMPFLNKFKNKNSFYRNAYTNASSTFFAMPSLMTGTRPFEKTNICGINSKNRRTFLPHLLGNDGYTNIGITGNIVTSRSFGYKYGWDYWEDFIDRQGHVKKQDKLRKLAKHIPSLIKDSFLFPLRTLLNKAFPIQNISISNKVSGWDILSKLENINLRKTGNFIFLHLMENHTPYASRNDILRFGRKYIENLMTKLQRKPDNLTFKEITRIRELYLNECRELDKILHRTINLLNKKLSNINIIITADHGESLGEGSYFNHPHNRIENPHQRNIPLVVKNYNITNKEYIWLSDLFYSITKKQNKHNQSFCVSYTSTSKTFFSKRYTPNSFWNGESLVEINTKEDLPYITHSHKKLAENLSI